MQVLKEKLAEALEQVKQLQGEGPKRGAAAGPAAAAAREFGVDKDNASA